MTLNTQFRIVLTAIITSLAFACTDKSVDPGYCKYCVEDSSVDSSVDSGRVDASSDSGRDALVDDAKVDAELPVDASMDAMADADTGVDAAVDPGPCGGACNGAKPVCYEPTDQCVECTAGDATHCGASKPLCDTGSLKCVECNVDSECGDSTKAQCKGDACVACESANDCTHFPLTPVCAGNGECGVCDASNESSVCKNVAMEATSCIRETGTCTDTKVGTLLPCQACVADSECGNGTKCVTHDFGVVGDVGSYCTYEKGLIGCAGADVGRRPYSREVTKLSVDGESGAYCLPPSGTTCEGIADAMAQGAMGGKVCDPLIDDCGRPNLSDASCVGTGPTANKCSYSCGVDADCPQTSLFTHCPAAGTKICQP